MKKILLISMCAFLLSCNDSSTGESGATKDSVIAVKSVLDTSINNVLKDSLPKQEPGNELANKILGTWALIDMENTSFVIEKKKISYPETFTSYKYSLVGDSLKIKYDGYTGSYLVRMSGADTLILTGDEEQVYYRFRQ